MIRLMRVVAACCVLFGFGVGSHAQSFPATAVKIIVPFPPGATTDIVAREVANQLGPRWRVPVIVENKAGASGIIGSEQIARAVGDPHLLMVTATHHVINPSLYKKLPYDPRRDFTSLALIASAPNVLIVNSAFPAQTVAELIKIAKEKPATIGFGSTGIGGANHLAGELFQVMSGAKLFHIPYKGSAPAMNDLLAGHAPVMFAGLASVIPHMQSGRLRALGVTSMKRVPTAPDIPTLDEAGVKGFEVLSWFGLYGPPQLPAAAVAKITADVGAVLASAHIKTSFNRQGVDPGAMSQPEFARYVETEMDKWGRVIEHAKIPKQ
ncbi:MAG: tripartite tricarboxylate transporter substrate binding protein [Betaproteobacteria bacterium]|nr:tripartite tricarboxylate transporter substrate binding protein [Betaproteobacteria bacterium]MBI2959088.1 tripartite tricarboxylate transporter substrate binding protein [Betaproteobacteria bacterium]